MFKKLLQKKTIQNGMWLYALQIFNTVLPVLVLPYVARILLPEEYGIFSMALNYVGYIVVVVEYGFNMTGARKIAVSKDPAEDSRIFSVTVLVRSALCLLCGAGVLIYCMIDGFGLLSKCMLALMLMSVGTVLDQTWFFQGKQDMKFIAIINMVSRCLSTGAIFLCVKDSGDLIIYCLLHASVTFINGLLGTVIVCKNFKLRLRRLSLPQFREDVKEGWYLFTSSFSSKVLSSFGITVLGVFGTAYDCGIFSALYKIPSMLLLAWNPISQILYPMTSAKMGESYQIGVEFVKRMEKIFVVFFGVICLLLCVMAKNVVGLLLGDTYIGHYQIVYPLLTWVLVAIFNNFLGVQRLLAAGYVKEYSICIQWSVLTVIVCNLVCIYFWGVTGAAFAPLLSEIMMTLMLQGKVKQIRPKLARNDEV